MASESSLQVLQDSTNHTANQVKGLQNVLKRLNGAKKDKDIKQCEHDLLLLVEAINNDLHDFQVKVNNVREELTAKQTETPRDDEEKDKKQRNKSAGATSHSCVTPRLPLPEDQEYAYQLKARMMPMYHEQNENLKAEILLMNRRNELRASRKHQQVNYHKESNLSAVTTLRAIQNYERKSKAAEARAAELQAELEDLKQEKGIPSQRSRPASEGYVAPSARLLNDTKRRNENLIEENQDHRREIQRLKHDNQELVKKAKTAQQDRHQIMAHLGTSEMARKELQSRLQKSKVQHDKLTRSMTRQSSDWIESRKQHNQTEEEWRWNNVGYASPAAGQQRTFSHPVPRNVDQPRGMYPVEKYSQPTPA